MRHYPDNWDDMSNYVVHFTKSGSTENVYDTMMSIYSSCTLKPASRFGIGKDRAPKEANQHAVCFSEIPFGQWQRLIERRQTKFGIAFSKEFVLSRGGGPVWYAWKDSAHWRTLQSMMSAAAGDPAAPIWRLTAMIDAPGEYGTRRYNFDWEREWRHIGSMSFTPEDVAFLLIPEDRHPAARSFFLEAYRENLGPAFLCPYVDPTWSKEKILAELKK